MHLEFLFYFSWLALLMVSWNFWCDFTQNFVQQVMECPELRCVCVIIIYIFFFLAIFRYFALRLFANFVSLLMRKKPKKIRKKLKKSQILCIKFCVFSSYYEGFQHSSVWYVLSNTSTAKRDLIPITLLLSCYCLLLAFE